MGAERITNEQRAAALQACREAGIGTSDCQLVRPDGEDYLELRSASGRKRLAVIPMTLDGRVLEAWRT